MTAGDTDVQPNNPLHGVSLKAMLEDLVERRGWDDLGARIRIGCFRENPSIASSLKFLRKTEWARLKVEQLFLEDLQVAERNRKRNKRRAGMRAARVGQDLGKD
ncbi:MAG: VF530 family DNA-binding protein [Candidatus Binatia bacterium]